MSLFLDDGDVRLYHGDALTVLQTLEAESVHMCVTSPPFYGLRDYGTGRWDGGDPDCDHAVRNDPRIESSPLGGGKATTGHQREGFGAVCPRCGARRVDQQIGLEETPEAWCQSLVDVFREVRRVLRPEGTLWLEIGDSYVSGQGGRHSAVGELPPTTRSDRVEPGPRPDLENAPAGWGTRNVSPRFYPGRETLLKPKDLIGAPWQLAFALRADGWWLRSDIVWARPNPMPESVTDRPTKSHSYIFLLSKNPRYFFDQEAVRENYHRVAGPLGDRTSFRGGYDGTRSKPSDRIDGPHNDGRDERGVGRNVRSVWTIATQPFPDAHFATFPGELARRCILAGTSGRGCCPECGAPWVRKVEQGELVQTGHTSSDDPAKYRGDDAYGEDYGATAIRTMKPGMSYERHTIGWKPSCAHNYPPPLKPCVVLDPFVGSGTVPFVARKHGRHAIGIDLSSSYLELAARRLQQLSLFA